MVTLYNGLLEFGDIVSVNDAGFESSVSFDITQLKEVYNESPEYYTPEILITLFHYLKSSEIAEVGNIVENLTTRILGQEDPSLVIDYALALVDNESEWVEMAYADKVAMMNKNIVALLRENLEREIFKMFISLINEGHRITLEGDMGGNTITLFINNIHTHCGIPDGSYQTLIETISRTLKGQGLSFA